MFLKYFFNPDAASKATYIDKAYRGWNKTIRNWDAAAKLIMPPSLSLPASFWFVIRFDSPRSCVTPTAPTHRIADNIFKFALTSIIELLMGAARLSTLSCIISPPYWSLISYDGARASYYRSLGMNHESCTTYSMLSQAMSIASIFPNTHLSLVSRTSRGHLLTDIKSLSNKISRPTKE